MKVQSTNGSLLSLDNDIQAWRGNALELFLGGKIQKFYQDNGIRLNSIKEKRKEMITEYFVVEDGKVKTEVVEGVEQPLFKDVLRKKEFNDAMKEFMDKEIAIEI